MPEFIITIAIASLCWLVWRLYQAKQYNRFIDWLNADIKPKLLEQLQVELIENRSEVTPNTDAHIQATLYYYQQYPIRIFEGALHREIILPIWLEKKQNKRFISHLLALQNQHRISIVEKLDEQKAK